MFGHTKTLLSSTHTQVDYSLCMMGYKQDRYYNLIDTIAPKTAKSHRERGVRRQLDIFVGRFVIRGICPMEF